MVTVARGAGDSYYRKPGTSNREWVPRIVFPWVRLPEGRVAKVAGVCIAYHLGYTDSMMGKLHRIPPAADINNLFIDLMPWFPRFYNEYRDRVADRLGFEGKIEEYNAGDIENRVRYCYCKPGSSQSTRDKHKRKYGISKEHPDCEEQQYKLRIVWARCSEEIAERLILRKSISQPEAIEWGTY